MIHRGAAILLAGVTAAAVGAVPPAAADPLPPVGGGGQSAAATIDDLQAQGFDVRINWTTGFDTKPLSECWVTDIDDPGHEQPVEGVFTTVYVDVSCPNGDDGPSFGGGVGVS